MQPSLPAPEQVGFLQSLPQIVTAIGGLGVAAFGLVDACKVFNGGVNHIGFKVIRERINQLLPECSVNGLSRSQVLNTLQQNWFNGTDLASQKSIAKSLIKLNFSVNNASIMAAATGLDADVLKTVADSVASGQALTTQQSDLYARFDLILTALLDATYQRADNKYRNGTRAWAVVAAVLLAIAGSSIAVQKLPWFLTPAGFWKAVLVGVLATPLAPIAKDLSTALATAVNTMQLVKK